VNHPQIAIFARLAKENTPYIRSIEGQKSLLGRTMHDFAYDPIHDEIVITSALAQAILTFRGNANGEEAPIRIIQGNKTGILAVGALDKVTIDAEHGEYYITTPNQEVLVFSRLATGNAEPIRRLKGPDTGLKVGQQKDGIFTGKGGNPNIRVDPIHNLLLVPVNDYSNTSQSLGERKILVFDRTATGNTKPRAVVYANSLGAIYAPKQRLINHNRAKGQIEIWNIPDSGEVRQPIITIPCPLEDRADGGVMDLDPAHKEVIMATAAGNTIVTYYVPEAFD
jgi:hypothetical protein